MSAPAGLGTTRFVPRGTTRLTYEAAGDPDAPAVAMFHGLLADRAVWRAMATALADRGFRALLIDARGHGSSAALSTRPYPPTELAADALAILDHAGANPAHLVGDGWGAAIAIAVARMSPEHVRSLALMQPDLPGILASDPDPAGRWAWQTTREGRSAAATAAGKGMTDRALDLLLDPRLGPGWRARMDRPRLAAIKRYGGALGPILTGAEGQEPAPEILAALTMPALILRAPHPPEVDARAAARLAALLPAAALADLTASRAPDALAPDDPAVIAAVAAFLVEDRHGPSPTPSR
jgi:pimeloyl-ACP methyl ester carboxylesterase